MIDARNARSPEPSEQYDPGGRFALWTAVCCIGAGPSFFLGLFDDWNAYGMVAGVLVFVAFYTIVSGTGLARRFERDPIIKRTLRIGYGTRVAVSILFPIGFVLDAMIGIASVSVADRLWGGSHGFAATLGTVLIDGILQNVLLGVCMLAVYGVIRIVSGKPIPEGMCQKCGYDLRGSRMSARCSECGTPTPWAAEVLDRRP